MNDLVTSILGVTFFTELGLMGCYAYFRKGYTTFGALWLLLFFAAWVFCTAYNTVRVISFFRS